MTPPLPRVSVLPFHVCQNHLLGDVQMLSYAFFSFEPENCILPKLSGSCIPRGCNQLLLHITWSSHGLLAEALPSASAFPAAEASKNVWLVLPTQWQIQAVVSGIQVGWVRVSCFSGLFEHVLFCFFSIKLKRKLSNSSLISLFICMRVGGKRKKERKELPMFSFNFFPQSYVYLVLFNILP